MTNVGPPALIRFKTLASSSCSKFNWCNSYSTLSNGCRTNEYQCLYLGRYFIYTNNARYCQLYKAQKRFVTDSERNCKDKGETSGSNTSSQSDKNSSSSHQQYHREAYERKRTSYEQNRTGCNKSEETKSSHLNIPMNHYQRLNILPEADLDTIKSAYYSLSKIYHPDIVGASDTSAVENFRLITESYHTLSDPQLRSDYDRLLSSNSIQFTSLNYWEQSSHPDQDFNPILRSRDADLIFKQKQAAALQREKKLNPMKFRAGTFKSLNEDIDTISRIINLQKRLKDLNTVRYGDKKGGNDFYKMHLADTIRRRESDLRSHLETYSDYKRTSNHNPDSDFLSFISFMGITLVTTIVIMVLYFDIDLPDYLDRRLEQTLSRADSMSINRVHNHPNDDR